MSGGKKARDFLLYLGARFFLLLPGPAAAALFGAAFEAGCLASARVRKMRDQAERNIAVALPGMGPVRRRRLVKRVVRHLAFDSRQSRNAGRTAWLERAVYARGLEHLDRARAAGRGVICLSAHFGSFPLMLAWLAARGYPVTTIIRDFRNPWLERYFRRIREKAGISRIPRHPDATALRRAIRWLRAGGILFIVADQHSDTGPAAPFFGVKTGTPAGPAALSRKLGCPVLPVSIRFRHGRHRLLVEPPLELASSDDLERDIAENAARFNRVIEAWVREAPEQWSSWLNRRFPGSPGNPVPQPPADRQP